MFNKTAFYVIFNLPNVFAYQTSFIIAKSFIKALTENTREAFTVLEFLKQPTKEEIWRFKDSLNRGLSDTSFSFFKLIHFIYFAINQKSNNSIQKYIKDNIQYSTELSYLQD